MRKISGFQKKKKVTTAIQFKHLNFQQLTNQLDLLVVIAHQNKTNTENKQ
jgi:hypothetical protein